jgi:hypothetical protein
MKADGGEREDVFEAEPEGLAPGSTACTDKRIGKPNPDERRAALPWGRIGTPKPLQVGHKHVPPELRLIGEQRKPLGNGTLADAGTLRALRAHCSAARRNRKDEAR